MQAVKPFTCSTGKQAILSIVPVLLLLGKPAYAD